MRSQPHVLLLLAVLLLAVGHIQTSVADDMPPPVNSMGDAPPGWELIVHVEEPFYWQVGRFAVLVHFLWSNSTMPVPALDHVVWGCTRPAGNGEVEYLLVLHVADRGTYRALVRGVPAANSQDWKLMSFQPVN